MRKKTPLEKFLSSRDFKTLRLDCQEETWWHVEFISLHEKYSYDHKSRNKRICFWIENNIKGWVDIEDKSKNYHNSTLDYFTTVYGKLYGPMRYHETNEKKDNGLFRNSEFQKQNSIKANIKKKSNNGKSDTKNVNYWICKHGMSLEEAKNKISEIQNTNNIENYIKKYGEQLGVEKFFERKEKWVEKINIPEIHSKRSLSLDAYKVKYGEEEGSTKYFKMRAKRNANSRIGCASIESLKFFKPLTDILDNNNIHYFIGVAGNKEFFIRKDDVMYMYDLTIPKLSIILEYHGKGFHPDVRQGNEYLKNWKQAYTNKGWKEVHENDVKKKNAAIENGWEYYQFFPTDSNLLHEFIHNLFQSQVPVDAEEVGP